MGHVAVGGFAVPPWHGENQQESVSQATSWETYGIINYSTIWAQQQLAVCGDVRLQPDLWRG